MASTVRVDMDVEACKYINSSAGYAFLPSVSFVFASFVSEYMCTCAFVVSATWTGAARAVRAAARCARTAAGGRRLKSRSLVYCVLCIASCCFVFLSTVLTILVSCRQVQSHSVRPTPIAGRV